MVHIGQGSFTAPGQSVSFSGLLFDNDGTLIDSTEVINNHWIRISKELGIDYDTIISTAHGRRSIDTFKILSPERATWDYVRDVEGRLPIDFGHLAHPIPGALELLQEISDKGVPWAIVTSATMPLLKGWLKVMKMARPNNLVTAEDVDNGKPDPACYRLGAKRIGLEAADPQTMIVFEDSLSGIKSGKDAGYKVIALTTTHPLEDLRKAEPDWIVRDMTSVSLKAWDTKTGRGELEIRDALIGDK